MKKLGAKAVISDHILYHGADKKDLDRIVNNELAHKIADELIKSDMSKIIVSREQNIDMFEIGSTVYYAECCVLTKEEYKEYEDLKKFREIMKAFAAPPEQFKMGGF